MHGETVEVSAGVYAYIQPDGSWYLNNTGFPRQPARRDLSPSAHLGTPASGPNLGDMVAYNGGRPLTCHA